MAPKTPPWHAEARRMRRKGKTLREIGGRFGKTVERVRQVTEGIPVPDRCEYKGRRVGGWKLHRRDDRKGYLWECVKCGHKVVRNLTRPNLDDPPPCQHCKAFRPGDRVGRLEVVESLPPEGGRVRVRVRCTCPAGKEFVAQATNLRPSADGRPPRTRSCGCINRLPPAERPFADTLTLRAPVP